MSNLTRQIGNRPREIRPVPNQSLVERAPLVGLATLYLSGSCDRLGPNSTLALFLVPGRFKNGTFWATLNPNDSLEFDLLINGVEVLTGLPLIGGMNRFDVDLATAEGDRVCLRVSKGNAGEVCWGIQLNQGVI